MVENFLDADIIQIYGTHLIGKTTTLTQLTHLLQYSYDRVVVAESDRSEITVPADAQPNCFAFVRVASLTDLNGYALPSSANLLVVDDYDAYGTSATERRLNAQRLLDLRRVYQKIIISTPTTPHLDSAGGRYAIFKLTCATDAGEQYVRITYKNQHTSVDCFLLALSRRLKLRHLA